MHRTASAFRDCISFSIADLGKTDAAALNIRLYVGHTRSLPSISLGRKRETYSQENDSRTVNQQHYSRIEFTVHESYVTRVKKERRIPYVRGFQKTERYYG